MVNNLNIFKALVLLIFGINNIFSQSAEEILKKAQLRHFWNFKQFRNIEKIFYDDKQDNLKEIKELGNCQVINAKIWNGKFA